MTPGIHRNVSERDYHALPLCSASRLNRLAESSPAHVRWEIDHPRPQTPEMAFGSAVHSLILTPATFAEAYTLAPFENFRSKEAQVWRAEAQAAGRVVLSPEDWEAAHAIRNRVVGHPKCAAALSQAAERELTVIWDHPEEGLRIKSRIDAAGGVMVDLKTTRSAHPDAFPRSLVDLGYHRQLALYVDGLAAAGMPVDAVVIIAVEKEPPYEPALYLVGDAELELARRELAPQIRRYAACEATGIWEGYGDDVSEIRLPEWYVRRAEKMEVRS